MDKNGRLEKRIQRLVRLESSNHQLVIERLVRRLKKKYDDSKFFRNFYFENALTDEVGECDLLMLNGFYNGDRRYALIFEVKASRRKKDKERARLQLEKAKRDVKSFYGEDVRCFCFSVYTSSNYFRNKKWNQKPYSIKWIRD